MYHQLWALFFLPLWDRVLLCSLGCPGACHVDQADIEFREIHLLLPPECHHTQPPLCYFWSSLYLKWIQKTTETQVPSAKVIDLDFATLDLITWVYSPLDLFPSNFGNFLRKQNTAEEYFIWLHNAKSSPPPGSLIKSCFYTAPCPWIRVSLKVSGGEFTTEKWESSLKCSGHLLVPPASLQTRHHNCLLNLMLSQISSGIKLDWHSAETGLVLASPSL